MNRPAAATTLLLTLGLGCADPVSVEDLPGSYEATTFTVREGGATEDLLAQGASFAITLDPNGLTSGRLFIPDGSEDGSDLDADLTGTWTFVDGDVLFDQTADTFVRDMPFAADDDRLVGEEVFGSATLSVILERQ